MPWYNNIVPENIKKNICVYLLQRYLGKFFEEKITRDQLTLNLSDGRASVEKVHLDVQVNIWNIFLLSKLSFRCY